MNTTKAKQLYDVLWYQEHSAKAFARSQNVDDDSRLILQTQTASWYVKMAKTYDSL